MENFLHDMTCKLFSNYLQLLLKCPLVVGFHEDPLKTGRLQKLLVHKQARKIRGVNSREILSRGQKLFWRYTLDFSRTLTNGWCGLCGAFFFAHLHVVSGLIQKSKGGDSTATIISQLVGSTGCHKVDGHELEPPEGYDRD